MKNINPVEEAKFINRVFSSLGVDARVTQAVPTPAYYYYPIQLKPSQKLAKVAAAVDDVQARLHRRRANLNQLGFDEDGAPIPTSIRYSSVPVSLEANRPNAKPLAWERREWAMRPYTALAGRYFDSSGGYPVAVDLTKQPHCLVAGATGSGKTVLLDGLLASFAESTSPDKLRFMLVDLDSDHFRSFAVLPHTMGIADDPDKPELAETLIMRVRNLMKADRVYRVVLVIDELSILVRLGPHVVEALEDIAQRGRKHGVHLLMATQKPLASEIGSLVKSNIPVRICGAVTSAQDSNTVLDVAGCGAEKLPGNGSFIYRSGQTVRRFQAYNLTKPRAIVGEICGKYSHLAPPAPVHLPRVPFSEVAPPCTTPAPVHAPPLHHLPANLAPPAAPPFPLAKKRPLHRGEIAQVRYMASQGMSNNKLQEAVYGSKSTRYKAWIDEALSTQKIEPSNVINLSQRRVANG